MFSLGLLAALSRGDEAANIPRELSGPSWPKKPDKRLSPLSGKTKEISEISPRFYGTSRDLTSPTLVQWQKESSMGQRPLWETSPNRLGEKSDWNQAKELALDEKKSGDFEPEDGVIPAQAFSPKDLEMEQGPDWISRSSRSAHQADGALRMYEGRLTRVREQVWRESENGRDLGKGRQEQYAPEEVEKMLAQPVAEIRGKPKEQSRSASQPATGGN